MMQFSSSAMSQRRWVTLLSFVLLLSLSACSQPKPWALDNLSGLMPRLKFNLTNDAGQDVNAAAYRGKVVLLYFGYTHCPDVCPTALAKLGEAIHGLGADASKTRILFVTVDPERDSVAVLHKYVQAFGPEFVGLRGSDDSTEALAKRYRVAFTRQKPNRRGDYDVTHSSAVFIFDGKGKVRLLATDSDSAASISHDLRLLLDVG